jgi:hypothetical protein
LRLHQRPEGGRQVIGGDVLPGFGLGRQIRHAIHHHRRIQALQHGKQFGLVRRVSTASILRSRSRRAIAGQHQALQAVHPVLGAQELGPLLQVVAQRLGGQAQVFQQDGRGVRPKRLAAQAHVQQPVLVGSGSGWVL